MNLPGQSSVLCGSTIRLCSIKTHATTFVRPIISDTGQVGPRLRVAAAPAQEGETDSQLLRICTVGEHFFVFVSADPQLDGSDDHRYVLYSENETPYFNVYFLDIMHPEIRESIQTMPTFVNGFLWSLDGGNDQPVGDFANGPVFVVNKSTSGCLSVRNQNEGWMPRSDRIEGMCYTRDHRHGTPACHGPYERFRIQVVEEGSGGGVVVRVPGAVNVPDDVTSDFGFLLRSERFADFTFRLVNTEEESGEDEEGSVSVIASFPAHKCVLYARLPFFKGLFDAGMTDSGNASIDIPLPVSSEAVQLFLRFVYTSSLRSSADQSFVVFLQRPTSFLELAILGDYYRLPSLLGLCHKSFRRLLSTENAINATNAASDLACGWAVDVCVDFIRQKIRSFDDEEVERLKEEPRRQLAEALASLPPCALKEFSDLLL